MLKDDRGKLTRSLAPVFPCVVEWAKKKNFASCSLREVSGWVGDANADSEFGSLLLH